MRELDREGRERLEVLCKKHHEAVFRTCMRYSRGDRQWAMDRTHDVFLTLAHKLEGLADHSDLGGWLYRVSVNHCLMELRKERGWRKRVDQVRHFMESTAPSAEREVRARRDLGMFEEAVQTLPEQTRALIIMIYVDGLTQTEAAKALGISKGYASKLLSRGLAKLKEQEWEVVDD